MPQRNRLSTGGQVAVTVGLLVADLVAIGFLSYRYAITGWADSFDPDGHPEAPHVVWQAMWFLTAAAALSGGGLLALGWRIPGVAQLLVLGFGAAAFALLTTSP